MFITFDTIHERDGHTHRHRMTPWCTMFNWIRFSCWFETLSDKLQNVSQSVSVSSLEAVRHVATSVSVSRALTQCSVMDVVVPSALLELTWYCDFTNVQLFWLFWTVLLICMKLDVAFCLCTVIFIFYMDHASSVFRRCMCTLNFP